MMVPTAVAAAARRASHRTLLLFLVGFSLISDGSTEPQQVVDTASSAVHSSKDAASVRTARPAPVTQINAVWNGESVRDLHKEYGNIFKFGNRNAASHLWSTFLLERSAQMTHARLTRMFSGYCAISGSPIQPTDYNRYKLELQLANGGGRTRVGYLHYCCWPCVCDTQDFIKVDTKTIATAEGDRVYHVAVIGNPCDHPEKLHDPFVQPFDRRETSIAKDAKEVRCGTAGELLGATLSDNGLIIIGMFFDIEGLSEVTAAAAAATVRTSPPQPGRVTQLGDVLVQDEAEYAPQCIDRARNGYNSGMGEIFRRVAAISPVTIYGVGADGLVGNASVGGGTHVAAEQDEDEEGGGCSTGKDGGAKEGDSTCTNPNLQAPQVVVPAEAATAAIPDAPSRKAALGDRINPV